MIRGGFLLDFSSSSEQLQMVLNSENLTGSSCTRGMRYTFSRTGCGRSQKVLILDTVCSVGGWCLCVELEGIVVARVDGEGGRKEVVCGQFYS